MSMWGMGNFILVLAVLAWVAQGSAVNAAEGPTSPQIGQVAGGVGKVRNASQNINCGAVPDPEKAACAACKEGIDKAAKDVNAAWDDAYMKEQAAIQQGLECPILQSDTQWKSQYANAGKNACSKESQGARRRIADDMAQKAKECKKDVGAKPCPPSVKQHQDKAMQGCKDIEKVARNTSAARGTEENTMGNNAGKSDVNGMNLNDLAKLAGAAAPLLAQMMQKKDDSSGASSYQPTNYPDTNSGISDPAETEKSETEVASLGDGKTETGANGVNGVSFGNPNGSTVSLASKEGTRGGFNPSSGADGRKIASTGAASSPFGAATTAGGVGSSGGGGVGGRGSSGNSSGASKMGDGLGGKSESEKAFEMSMSGGAKLLGLKGGKEDLDELTSAGSNSTTGDAKLDDISFKGGAGSQSAAADSAMGDESIFLRVRKKLSSIKMSGRL